MDPHEANLRKNSYHAVSLFLYTIVNKFPMVSFHQDTQRLAIGTHDALILMYDLRAHSKWRILEGHTSPITALAFDKQGKRVASFAKDENNIRVWKVFNYYHCQIGLTGFFSSILGIQNKNQMIDCNTTKKQEVPFRGKQEEPKEFKMEFYEKKFLELTTPQRKCYRFKLQSCLILIILFKLFDKINKLNFPILSLRERIWFILID